VRAVLVVGGGAAGCELAWGLARRGVATTLLTTSLDTLYALPADAWPGRPPAATLWSDVASEARDAAGLQRAGPLRRAAKRELERLADLRVVQSNATALARGDADEVVGVRTWEGPPVRAWLTVLAVGSFLGARLTLGPAVERAGRLSEMAYDDLRDDLRDAGLRLRRHTVALAGDGVAPAYAVEHDVVAEDELDPLRMGGRVVAGAGRARRWPGLWFVGACTGDVGLEAAAAAGRDLAAHLAAAGA
jgi:tRNA U34 5-carboxymethylaminomethyl modifying enzyme MnmG/GidA